MRIYAIPKDTAKTHMNIDEKSKCRLGRSLYNPIKLTKEPTMVTCERCQILMGLRKK